MSDKKANQVPKLKYLKIGSSAKVGDSKDEVTSVKIENTVLENKKDVETTPENNKTISQQKDSEKIAKNFEEKTFSVPNFLNKAIVSDKKKDTEPKSKGNKMLPFVSNLNDDNPNSISSVFNKDHQEVFGIQRVFKKSIIFLILNLVGFSILTFFSVYYSVVPVWYAVIAGLFYASLSNIFYIIVADRSYVNLSLAGQLIILLAVHSFLGRAFDVVTLAVVFVILVYNLFAYSEIEKIQLSSRLFSIGHVTKESTRILVTVFILVISLGLFNGIVSSGSAEFFDDVVLSNDNILDEAIIGRSPNLSLNRIFLNGGRFYIAKEEVTSTVVNSSGPDSTYIFSDFLRFNYDPTKDLLSSDREEEIRAICEVSSEVDCDVELDSEVNKNLEAWRIEAYGDLPYTLNTPLTVPVYKDIVRQSYINSINKLESESTTSEDSSASDQDIIDTLSQALLIDRTYIIPSIFALVIFLALTLVRFVFNWLIFILTWIFWHIMIWTGFARIEIENVEAEIVSI